MAGIVSFVMKASQSLNQGSNVNRIINIYENDIERKYYFQSGLQSLFIYYFHDKNQIRKNKSEREREKAPWTI